MTRGTGTQHSESNGAKNEHLSLFKRWIRPYKNNVTPRYDQAYFKTPSAGELQILVSSINNEKTSGLKIHQDAQISRINLKAGSNFEYVLKSKSHGVYVMQVTGVSEVSGQDLNQRDAVGISKVNIFLVEAHEASQLLFIEVPNFIPVFIK